MHLMMALSALQLAQDESPRANNSRWELIRVGDSPSLFQAGIGASAPWVMMPGDARFIGEQDSLLPVGAGFGACGNIAVLRDPVDQALATVVYDCWGNTRTFVVGKCRLTFGNGTDDQITMFDSWGLYRADGYAPSPDPQGTVNVLTMQIDEDSWFPYYRKLEGPIERWWISDLSCPTLIQTEAGVELLFAGTRMGMDRQLVWIGNLASREGNSLPNVRFVGEGDRPRYVKIDDIHVVVARIWTMHGYKGMKWTESVGPLVWYKSLDLHTWVAMGEIDAGHAFCDFDVMVQGKELVVVGMEVSRKTADVLGSVGYALNPEDGGSRRIEGLTSWKEPGRFRLLSSGEVLTVPGETSGDRTLLRRPLFAESGPEKR